MKSLFGNLLAHKFIVTIAAVCTLSVTTAAFVVPNILLQKDAEVENNVPNKMEQSSNLVEKTQTELKEVAQLTEETEVVEKAIEGQQATFKQNESKPTEPKVEEQTQKEEQQTVPEKVETPGQNEDEATKPEEEEQTQKNEGQQDIPEVEETTPQPSETETTKPKEEEQAPKDEGQQTVPEVEETTPQPSETETTKPKEEEQAPKDEEQQTVPEIGEITPQPDENKTTETKNEEQKENLFDLLKDSLQKTKDVNSVYYISEQTGLYQETLQVKYNKSQHRQWIRSDLGEDYLEGIPGRYVSDSKGLSYYNQSWWRLTKDSSTWLEMGRIHSGFGISFLRFLNHVKDIEEYKLPSGRLAFRTFTVTIDQADANKAGEIEFNKTNMFKKDIQLQFSIDHNGYIVLIVCNWDHSVLEDSIPNIHYSVRMGNFNKTDVVRPTALKNATIPDYPLPDPLTQTKKKEIADQIEAAYAKTRDANSATYETNDKEVQFNKNANEAIMKDQNSTTYYKGTDGMYTESDYVSPSYHQDSWTKAMGSDVWKQNVRKHTAFLPKELYFLTHIFDVSKVETKDHLTTYTVTVLKYDANVAYNYANNCSGNQFDSDITFIVTLDDQGYIRELHIDLENYHYDLVISNIENTTITKPSDLQ